MSADINGYCDEKFHSLEDAFRANFEEGLELGASLGVTWQGKMVVDLWGGSADPRKARPWQKDTIVVVSSTSKIALTISILMLIDRGLIELDAPIARYWPEFAQGGKAHVTIRDLLTHQTGVPGFVPALPYEAWLDWELLTSNLAAQKHWFEGRKVVIYHALTYGHLAGELVRRVDGRRPARFVREEIAEKAGADFQIGLSSQTDLERLASVQVAAAPPRFPEGSPAEKAWVSIGTGVPDWQQLSADKPGGNGYTNGRAIARICAILAMGGKLDGVRYLSKRIVQEAGTEQIEANDLFMGPIKYGLGFGLDSHQFPAPSPTTFHWGGYGGSWGLMDPKTGLSLGYAPNNWITEFEVQDPRQKRFSDALAEVMRGL